MMKNKSGKVEIFIYNVTVYKSSDTTATRKKYFLWNSYVLIFVVDDCRYFKYFSFLTKNNIYSAPETVQIIPHYVKPFIYTV